jgi:Carboxypeptidase regulatory-like domain
VTASIVGVVVYASGPAIPGAAVSVLSTERNDVVRKIATDPQGAFVAALLPIGRYSVKPERDGFKTAVREGIESHVNDKLAVRLELQVGQHRRSAERPLRQRQELALRE